MSIALAVIEMFNTLSSLWEMVAFGLSKSHTGHYHSYKNRRLEALYHKREFWGFLNAKRYTLHIVVVSPTFF